MTPSPRPRLVYDGDCGFCTRCASWIAVEDGAFEVVPWQSLPDLAAVGLTVEDVATAVYWVAPDGTLSRGSDAVGQALLARGGLLRLLGRVVLAAPVRPVAGAVYRVVAANRYRLPGSTAACRTDRH